MRTPTAMRVAAAAAAAGLLLTGCGSNDEQATGGDAAASTQESNLDTGTFPTTPQPEFGSANPEKAGWIESQRMAEFLTMPFEVDPELVKPFAGRPYEDADSASSEVSDGGAAAIEDSFVAGFRAAGGSYDETNTRELTTAVIRLKDAAAVEAALPKIKAGLIEGTIEPGVEDPIDILPNTTVVSSVYKSEDKPEASVTVQGVTPHNNYLLFASAWTVESDKAWTATAIAEFVEQQVPLIDKFPATPAEEIPDITMDQDKVLIYTVPHEDGPLDMPGDQAVLGPRGAAITAANFRRSYQRLLDSNVTHMAISNTTVYKTGSEEDAKNLIDGFVEDNLKVEGTVEAEPPAGLETARCITPPEYVTTCWVANGPYVGEVSMSVPEDDQKLAAQYVILGHAK
ncbi:MAG: hypothetical protein GX610_05350 [Rhodococcus sp.]|nr:hypothetical protein [Rhodococcus sp. (in: high G+C Gram-positive bacteria)]